MEKEIYDKLGSINWDFGTRKIVDRDSIFPFNNRKYHSYPATYIPELPFALIEILSKVGDIVLDPFGGIGTTFIQALIQNRVPISIDNNLVASLITRDFFTLFNPNNDLLLYFDQLLEMVKGYDKECDYFSSLDGKRQELSGWYEANTLNELSFLITQFDFIKENGNNDGLEKLFHLCLSNLLTTVCSQNGGWAYIADNVRPKYDKLKDKYPINRFITNASLCVKNVQKYKNLLGKSTECIYLSNDIENVINADFVHMDINPLKGIVDLVVTSPPYPRMIDYVKSQRLSFYIENCSFSDELQHEIGARYRRNNRGTIEEYISDMKMCNHQLYESLKTGGHLCYILPDFPVETDRKAAIDAVIEDCNQLGFSEVYRTDRYIPGTQRSNNIKWASLKKELIIVMEKVR